MVMQETEDAPYAEYGRLLKASRIQAKLTQLKVSELTGIPLRMVQEYEQGRCLPSARRQIELVSITGIDFLELIQVVERIRARAASVEVS